MEIQKKKLTLITLAHFFTDAYPGFVPIVLPIMADKAGFSKTAVGTLLACMTIATNFPQPFFGYYYDRTKKYLIYLSPLFSAVFMVGIFLLPGYLWVMISLIIGGIGVAWFHPQGTHIAHCSGGDKKELALSIFLGCGLGGYASGAFIAGVMIDLFGINSLLFTTVFGIAFSAILYKNKTFLTAGIEENGKDEKGVKKINDKKGFIKIMIVITMIVSLGSTIFSWMPVFLKEKGITLASIQGISMLLFLIPGSLGGMVAGRLAKKYSAKKLIICSSLLGVAFIYAFILLPSPYFIFLIPVAGGFLLSSNPLLVNIAYKYLPENIGVAGGTVIGLTWGFAFILMIITGALADILGTVAKAYMAISVLPIVSCIMMARIKE